jgi:hypothetical protein
VERNGRRPGRTGGVAKGGGWRRLGLAGHWPREAKPGRAAADGVGDRLGVGRGGPSQAGRRLVVTGWRAYGPGSGRAVVGGVSQGGFPGVGGGGAGHGCRPGLDGAGSFDEGGDRV